MYCTMSLEIYTARMKQVIIPIDTVQIFVQLLQKSFPVIITHKAKQALKSKLKAMFGAIILFKNLKIDSNLIFGKSIKFNIKFEPKIPQMVLKMGKVENMRPQILLL